MSAALPLIESTLMELLVHNRRNLSGRDKRKLRGFTLLPACTRVAFQTPRGSPIASLLGLKEPLGLFFPARLQMRAAQLRKRSTLRRFRRGRHLLYELPDSQNSTSLEFLPQSRQKETCPPAHLVPLTFIRTHVTAMRRDKTSPEQRREWC